MSILLKCGHSSMSIHIRDHDGLGEKHPSCLIHETCEVAENVPDLTGRTSRCAYFGSKKPRRRYANDECNYGCNGKDLCECGQIPSRFDLAFFEHQPTMGNDKFYCGCHGWD